MPLNITVVAAWLPPDTHEQVLYPPRNETVSFSDGAQNSSLFLITQAGVATVGTMEVGLSIGGTFEGVIGVNLAWRFCNPGAYRLAQIVQLAVTFLAIDVFAVYLLDLQFDSEKWTQIFLIAVGIAGILAATPLGSFFSSHRVNRIEFFLPCFFVVLLRSFVLLQFYLLTAKMTTIQFARTLLTVLLFLIYAVFDAEAAFNRRTALLQTMTNAPLLLPLEQAVGAYDLAYMIGSIYAFVRTALLSEAASRRRVWLLAVTLLTTHTGTIIARPWFAAGHWYSVTVLPQILYVSLHVSMGSALLFLLRTEAAQQYRNIEKQDGTIVLDVDVGSSEIGHEV
jgi:uncharacterized membrane protein YuzA (DUF378 family)